MEPEPKRTNVGPEGTDLQGRLVGRRRQQVLHQIGHTSDLIAKGQATGTTEEQAAIGVTFHGMPQLLVDAKLTDA